MKFRLLHLFIFLLVSINLFSRDIYFKHISTAEGLSEQSVVAIWQDQLGNMWFGNTRLNKYDGNQIDTYKISDYFGGKVNDSGINQILGDDSNNMYFIEDNKLISYNLIKNQFTSLNIKASCIYYKDKSLYAARRDTLMLVETASGKCKVLHCFKDNLSIKSILPISNKIIWVGTTKGLYKFVDGEVECVLNDEQISCLFYDSKKNIWVGTVDNGIRIIDPESHIISYRQEEPLNTSAKLYSNRIRCINEDNDHNIWIGTYQGITLFNIDHKTSSLLAYSENELYTLRHNSVYAIYKDKQGTMWVGTYYGGVSYSNPDMELYTYYKSSSLDPDKINGFIIGSMTEDQKGNLYVASEDGGINILNDKYQILKKLNTKNKMLPHNTVKSLYYDVEYDKLYAGVFTKGLYVYDNITDKISGIGSELLTRPEDKIISHIIPYRDELIILTQGGLYKLDRKKRNLEHFDVLDSYSDQYSGIIRNITISEDDLWFSTSNKDVCFINLKTGRFEKVLDENSNSIGNVVRIINDKLNNIYLLTSNKLYRYDTDKACLKQMDIFTTEGWFNNIALTSDNNLLMISNTDLELYNISDKKLFTLPLKRLYPLNLINKSSGLYVSVNGTINIGGIGGMVIIRESDLKLMSQSKGNGSIHFSTLAINNERIECGENSNILKSNIAFVKDIKLNYKQNNISVTFSSSNYASSGQEVYEYQLKGYDRQRTISTDRTIRYTSLPPGKYSLIVNELNNKGQRAKLDFIIEPPFYASVWAYIFYTLLALSFIVLAIWFLRRNELLKAKLLLEQREKDRIGELDQMKMNFFTNVSHEFRTPLTLIVSQIDLLLAGENYSRSLKNRLLKVKKYIGQIQYLITELMHFNKLEQGSFPLKLDRQDINKFLEDIYLAFKDYADQCGIEFKYEHTGEQIDVWFDSLQIQKVIYNLLSNAFKYTKADGKIIMTLKKEGRYAEISIADTGIGIKETELKNVFERYYQVDSTSDSQILNGMGVGLTLSKSIVKEHHGEIDVQSVLGKGSCFTVKLLLGDSHFTEIEKNSEQVSRNIAYSPDFLIKNNIYTNDPDLQFYTFGDERSKYSVLIVEDNAELLNLLVETFSPIYTVITAADGKDAITMATENLPDLIIADVMMPRLSGIDMCKHLKNNILTNAIPIILLSAQASDFQISEALKCGADDYIIKPFNIEILLLKVHNFIRRKNLLTEMSLQSMQKGMSEMQLSTKDSDRKFLDNAILILDDNISNVEFDTKMWSKSLNIGRSKLFEKVKNITGLTPNEFIIKHKMEKSIVLLKEQSDLTIAEIAYKLGFSSPAYFSKCFKDRFGITPLQFRNN